MLVWSNLPVFQSPAPVLGTGGVQCISMRMGATGVTSVRGIGDRLDHMDRTWRTSTTRPTAPVLPAPDIMDKGRLTDYEGEWSNW
jgi:hypothetical protein